MVRYAPPLTCSIKYECMTLKMNFHGEMNFHLHEHTQLLTQLVLEWARPRYLFNWKAENHRKLILENDHHNSTTHNSHFNCNCCTAGQLWSNVHFANFLHPKHTHTESVIISNNWFTRHQATKHWILINDWFAFNSFGALHSPFYTLHSIHCSFYHANHRAAPAQIAIELLYNTFSESCVRAEQSVHHHRRRDTKTWQPTVFYTFACGAARTAPHTPLVYFWPTLSLRRIWIPCRTGAERCRVLLFHSNCIYTFRGPFLCTPWFAHYPKRAICHVNRRIVRNKSWWLWCRQLISIFIFDKKKVCCPLSSLDCRPKPHILFNSIRKVCDGCQPKNHTFSRNWNEKCEHWTAVNEK